MKRTLFVLFLLSGCYRLPETYRVGTSFDQLSLRPTTSMQENRLDIPESATVNGLLFNVSKTGDPSGDQYGITIVYRGDDWVPLQPQQPLQVFVDGTKMNVSCRMVNKDPSAKSQSDRAFGHWSLAETGIYAITLQELRDISNGHEVVVRLAGNTVVDGKFTPENFKQLRGFLTR